MIKNQIKRRKLYLKLFSFVFSIFIWLYVISSAQVEMDKIVPVHYKLPKGMALKEASSEAVVYRVKGPRLFVRKLIDKNDVITVDVKKLKSNRKKSYSVSTDKYKIKLPLSLELLNTAPRNLKFKLEKEKTKSVPIQLNLEDLQLTKDQLMHFEIKPNTVEVKGAKSLLRGLKKVSTSVLENFNASKSSTHKVQLVSPNPNVKISPSSVMVQYAKKSEQGEFTFIDIPIIFQSSRLIKTRSVKSVRVKLSGDKKIIEDLNRKSIQVFANVPDSKGKKKVIDLVSELPEGIKLLEIFPEKVRVELE